jgi:hypothetical protein
MRTFAVRVVRVRLLGSTDGIRAASTTIVSAGNRVATTVTVSIVDATDGAEAETVTVGALRVPLADAAEISASTASKAPAVNPLSVFMALLLFTKGIVRARRGDGVGELPDFRP